ncbi:hypothetical protein P153DRAFT_400087 [Dothidotthia symphoricarpi CBS 119687]|uniref:Uncharacterized protein n=1 Tax=Dothidotthia symphoricarpi CBS 119687 TaxID=1392245 RepID=A0A6A6A249_9PLEO|nr:uncharacterized protein P153DRAFT_400087 [Dothidotthia symphoricarpi CBS 119687]KAF2125254.1 hypothetical protein P153DRAFT_400087 [Dothidotthia symphoricarpi CBS 119687]
MPSTTTVAGAIACVITVCNAVTIRFWNRDGCTGKNVGCENWRYGDCCTGGSPWCLSANCEGCLVGNDIYSFNTAGCSRAPFGVCRAARGNGCCLGTGGGNNCAMSVYVGNSRKRDSNQGACEFLVRPNHMEYTDHNGTAHSIYIPTGIFDIASQHAANEDWDALNRYPAWANQSYTDADRIPNPDYVPSPKL